MARRRTKGTGEVFQESGGSWAFRWREAGKRRYRGGFPSRQLADRARTLKLAELAVRRAGLPVATDHVPTLGELAPDILDRRLPSHKAGKEDRYRWDRHLAPELGHLRPDQVDHAAVRRFAEKKLAEGLASGTVRVMVSILSAIFTDLQERGLAATNPARGLPKSLARLIRSSHDPRTVPFLERPEDIRRVFLKLEEPLNVAFALGVLGGLRPGEAFALRWDQVDLEARRIHLREQATGTLKDGESRMVPILDDLAPVLKAWALKTGGKGLVVPPLRRDGGKVDKGTRSERLAAALKDLGLARPGLGWKEATRHTFASQWVMAGGSIEKLKEILGHYSVVMTERYAHLRPELFTAQDLATVRVGLARPAGAPAAELRPGTKKAPRRGR